MKKKIVTAMTAILIAGGAMAGEEQGYDAKQAAEAKITLQTTCPVMGGKVNKDLYVDHDGQRIYVCCKGCIDTVRKNPEKYIGKLAEKGRVPAAVPENE